MMGLQPNVNYTRVRLMSNAVLPKLRDLSNGELQHWTDRDLGNILDMAVNTRIDEAEVWWEDDFAFGICMNKVVRVDEDLPAVNLPALYAVVRPCADVDAYGKDEIVVTIVNQKSYDLSITEGRWKEEKPEKSRNAHLDEEEEEEEEVAKVQAWRLEEEVAVGPNPNPKGVLISYVAGEGSERKAHYLLTTDEQLHVTVLKLLREERADPTTIFVWTRQSRVNISIQLEEMR